MSISSVVLDYGSVLAWPPSSPNFGRVVRVAGVPKPALLGRYYKWRSAYDRDTIDSIEYWRRVTDGYPASQDESRLRRLAALDVEIWSEPNDATVGWLPRLKQQGLKLALLSNMPESFCTPLEQRDHWLDIFDYRIFSGRVKLNKPEPAIYRLLLEKLDESGPTVRPENVLFLDDLEANVLAARSAGINAELYNVFQGGLTEIAERYGLPAPPETNPTEDRLRDTECAPHRQPA